MHEFRGNLKGVNIDFESGRILATFEIINSEDFKTAHESIKNEMLDIKVGKHREKRSLDANGMMWACIGEIATKLNTDKWSVYLKMLRDYGKFTYICVKPSAVDAMKKQWRECEEIGTININGTEATQLLCYFGSSTYDTKEFSVLLNGIVSEMRELGLQPPPSNEMKRSLEQWEKAKNGNQK